MKCKHCGEEIGLMHLKWPPPHYDHQVEPAEETEKVFDEKEMDQTEFTHRAYGAYTDPRCGHTHIGLIPPVDMSQTEKDLEYMRHSVELGSRQLLDAMARLILKLYEDKK
jgi:hypothetical protein